MENPTPELSSWDIAYAVEDHLQLQRKFQDCSTEWLFQVLPDPVDQSEVAFLRATAGGVAVEFAGTEVDGWPRQQWRILKAGAGVVARADQEEDLEILSDELAAIMGWDPLTQVLEFSALQEALELLRKYTYLSNSAHMSLVMERRMGKIGKSSPADDSQRRQQAAVLNEFYCSESMLSPKVRRRLEVCLAAGGKSYVLFPGPLYRGFLLPSLAVVLPAVFLLLLALGAAVFVSGPAAVGFLLATICFLLVLSPFWGETVLHFRSSRRLRRELRPLPPVRTQ